MTAFLRPTPGAAPRARRVLAAVALVAVLAAVLPGTAGGAGAVAGQVDERARREAVRSERAAAAAELDALQASDDELEAAVATLEADVAAQEARVADARRAVDEARAEVARLQDELAATEAEVGRLREDARERAIESYLGFGSSGTTTALHDGDPTDAERRKALLEAVTGSERDVVDQLGGATARLERQRQEVADALAEADARQSAAEQRLADLDGARAARAAQRDALRGRIAEFRSEVDALAAEEAALNAIIEQRAAAAQAAAAEEQAAARRSATPDAAATSSTSSSSSSSTTAGGSSTSAPPAPSGGGYAWPAAGTVTSGFGQRWGRLHAGLDISAPTGTPIVASRSGTVIHAGPQGAYGNLVLIDHGDGVVTAYAHQSRIAVGNGTPVARGQVIGYVGSTGRSTGPHLHFEVRVGGSPRDPMGYL